MCQQSYREHAVRSEAKRSNGKSVIALLREGMRNMKPLLTLISVDHLPCGALSVSQTRL